MNTSTDFSFGDDSVAGAYADVLVPIMFKPWADALIEAHGPWEGKHVLDLATGTGIVAHTLAGAVGSSGAVVGMDMNQEMLRVAETRAAAHPNLSFVACPAEQLDCADGAFDHVVCQQGFQFFSDRGACAGEVRRVLRSGGTAIASVWRPVAECEFFGMICASLEAIGEGEIADMMRVPFDFLPGDELAADFASSGFSGVSVRREQREMVLSGGIEHAIQAAFATPIGPRLRALPEDTRTAFVEAFSENAASLAGDGGTMGQLAADVVVATR